MNIHNFSDLPFVPPVSLMDLAIFKGKSAKIGWVKGTTFTKPIWKFDNHSYFTLTDIMTTPFKLQLASIELPTVTINSVEVILSLYLYFSYFIFTFSL